MHSGTDGAEALWETPKWERVWWCLAALGQWAGGYVGVRSMLEREARGVGRGQIMKSLWEVAKSSYSEEGLKKVCI